MLVQFLSAALFRDRATMTSSPPSNGMMNGKKRHRKTRLAKDAHIVIIGSGLGGLGAAISLEQAGFTNIEIFERDASAWSRREGYGLTLTYNPKGPLAQMGLLEEVAQRDCPSRSHYIFSVSSLRGLFCLAAKFGRR